MNEIRIYENLEVIENNELKLTEDDRKLLLASINYYIEKVEFNIKNADTYYLSDLAVSLCKSDLKRLNELRRKIYTINITDYIIE